MRQLSVILITCLVTCTGLYAQCDQISNPLRNVWSAQIGNLSLMDTYLSPMTYTGTAIGWEAQHERFYSKHQGKLSWRNRNVITLASTLNPAYTASMSYLGASVSFGTFYHFEPVKNLRIRTGGYVDLAPGVKYNSRNVNNIASADASVSLYGEVDVRYLLPIDSKFSMAFGGEIATPLAGVMFVPEMGINYYEMWKLKAFDNAFHFSSLHNKYGFKASLYTDLQFKGFALRLAYTPQLEYWKANHLSFKHQTSFFSLGTVVDLHLFAGCNSQQSNAKTW